MKKKKVVNLPRNKRPMKQKLASAALVATMLTTGLANDAIPMGQQVFGQSNKAFAATDAASSVNLADMANPELEAAKVVDFDSLGADPTGQTDSSAAWEKLLKMSETEALHVKFTPGGKYLLDIDHDIKTEASKGIYFDGQGATLLPKNTKPDPSDPASAQLYETYVGQIKLVKGANAGFKMDNLIIDGSRNPKDLFFTFQEGKWSGYDTSGIAISGLRKTRLMRGFHVENAEKLDVSDSKFENLFAGYTLLLENYRKVNINNLTLDHVGGDGQTDSLGMGLYFAGHTFDDTVININNFKMIGNLGNTPQSNPWTGVSNPGDPSYTSWIGIVIENGSIQANDPSYWKVDKNTTLNVTNSQIDNVEHTFHVESMAGNVAVNMNNVSSHAKAFGISAGIKGKYEFVGNKLNLELLPYGRNGLYATVFSSEFGDDPRYHNGYNANLTDASGGDPMHTNLVTNSKITFVPGERSLTDKNFGESYATVDYGNMVNGNFKCTQFDNLPDKLFANGGGYMTDVVVNLADINKNEATFAGIKGDPGAAGQYVKEENVTVNKAGSWTNLTTTCETPQFVNFSGATAPVLDSPVTPAPIGGGGTTNPPTTEAPTTEGATTEAPTTEAPTTEGATTEAPTTEAPTTEDVTTEDATTEAPTTENATTEEVTTEAPTTEDVTTEVPPISTPNPDGTYSIKGSVFQDKNFDGFFDPDTEGKVKSFKVVVKDASGVQVGETVTDANGNYSLDGLKPGTYAVSFMASSLEYAPTYSNQDLNVSDDRDSDGPTDVLVTITNADVLHVDQGYLNLPANADLTTPGETPQPEPSTTEEPTTEVPTTEAATTEAPVTTEAPTTEAPSTNQKPRIFAYDQFVVEGSAYDELDNVRAFDKEDGDLTDAVKLKSGKVDTSKAGSYDLTYEVTDKDGNVSERTVTVVVGNDWSDDIKALQDKQQAMQDQIDALIAKYEALDKKAGDLDTRVKALEDKVTAIVSQLEAINKNLDGLTKSIESLKAQYDGMKADVDGLKAAVKAANDRLDKIEKQVAELNTKYTELVKLVESNKGDIDKLKADVAALKTDTEALKTSTSGIQKQIDDLKSKVDALIKQVGKGSITITNNNTNNGTGTATDAVSKPGTDVVSTEKPETSTEEQKTVETGKVTTDDQAKADTNNDGTVSKEEAEQLAKTSGEGMNVALVATVASIMLLAGAGVFFGLRRKEDA